LRSKLSAKGAAVANSAGKPKAVVRGVLFFNRLLLDKQKKSVRLSAETDAADKTQNLP
jgi:hypothetical protein